MFGNRRPGCLPATGSRGFALALPSQCIARMDLAAPLALVLAGLYVVIRKAAAAGRVARKAALSRRE